MTIAVFRCSRTYFAYACLFSYCGLIFWLSSQSIELRGLPKFSDKVIHTVEYAVLGALALWAFGQAPFKRFWGRAFLAAWVFASLYGISDEWHQSFVPGRQCSAADALADTLGAALGAWLLFRFGRRFSRENLDRA